MKDLGTFITAIIRRNNYSPAIKIINHAQHFRRHYMAPDQLTANIIKPSTSVHESASAAHKGAASEITHNVFNNQTANLPPL